MFKEFNSSHECNYYSYVERYIYKLLNSFLKRYTEWLKYNDGLSENSILRSYLEDADVKIEEHCGKECLCLNGRWIAGVKCNLSFKSLYVPGYRYGYSELKAGLVRTCSFKFDEDIDYELICKINNYLKENDHLPQISVNDLNIIEITEYFDCGWLIEKYGTCKDFDDATESYNLEKFEDDYKEYSLSEEEELLIAREICSLDVVCTIISIISDESHKKLTVKEIMNTFIDGSF